MRSLFALLALAGLLQGQELARVLRREPDESRGREALIEALVRLDPHERPALVRLALGPGLEELLAANPPDTAWTVVPEALPGLARDALARLSPRTVCALLEAELAPEASASVRRAALRLLARVESEPCAALAWRLFLGLDGPVVAAPRAREEVRDALLAAFRADRAAAEAALEAVPELDPAAAEIALEALALTGRAELGPALAELARRPGAWATPALAALAELEARRPEALDGETRAVFEAVTAWSEPLARAELLLRLVRCEDPALVPYLIELGQVEDARTQRLARAALDELARIQPDPDPAAWSDWYARELEWRETRLAAALEEFAGDDPALAVRALHDCLRHPLFRREAAAGLAARLIDARAEAALAAMPTLAAWRSLACLPGLELALEAHSAEVRALAADTLALLVGA